MFGTLFFVLFRKYRKPEIQYHIWLTWTEWRPAGDEALDGAWATSSRTGAEKRDAWNKREEAEWKQIGGTGRKDSRTGNNTKKIRTKFVSLTCVSLSTEREERVQMQTSKPHPPSGKREQPALQFKTSLCPSMPVPQATIAVKSISLYEGLLTERFKEWHIEEFQSNVFSYGVWFPNQTFH